METESSSTSSSSSSSSSSTSLLLEDALIIPRFNLAQFLETFVVDLFSPFLAPLYVYLRGYTAARNGYHIYSTWIEWLLVPFIFLILGWTSKAAVILWIYLKNQESKGDVVLDSISHEVMTCLLFDLFWRTISPLHFAFLTPREFQKYLTVPNATVGSNHGFNLWLHGATPEIYSLEVRRSAARGTLRLNEHSFTLSGAHLSKLFERLGEGDARDSLWHATCVEKGYNTTANDKGGDVRSSQSFERPIYDSFSSFSSSSQQSIEHTILLQSNSSSSSVGISISSPSSSYMKESILPTPSTKRESLLPTPSTKRESLLPTPSTKKESILPTPSKYHPSIHPNDIYHLSVQALCVAILLHTKRFSSKGRHIDWLLRLRVLVVAAMCISPIISRVSTGLPPIGTLATTQFIILACCIFNFLYSFFTATMIIGGIEDFARRAASLRLLGELVERSHALAETEEEANAMAESILTLDMVAQFQAIRDSGGSGTNAIIPLESAGNVASWLASRRILKGVGLQYVLQFGLYTIGAVVFSIAQFAVTLIVIILTNRDPSNTEENSKPIPASSQGLLLLILYVGLLLFVIREGSIANKTASAHGDLAVALRAEAARKSALLRSKSNERRRSGQQSERERELADHECDHWDDVAKLLEIVPTSLEAEVKLKVLGLDATDTLFNSTLSAIASGVGLVLGILQYKFGTLWINN